MEQQQNVENKEAETKVAEENKAAAESTVEGGEGNGEAKSPADTTEGATATTDAGASTASTEGEKTDTYNVNGNAAA